jgi:sortase B
MELGDKKQTNRHKKRVEKVTRFRRRRQLQRRYRRYTFFLSVILSVCILVIVAIVLSRYHDNRKENETQNALRESINNSQLQVKSEPYTMPTAGVATVLQNILNNAIENSTHELEQAEMLPKYQSLYEQNSDMIGWLKIEDTVIDYPVMQTMEDEDYYLDYDFNKEENMNGCLIMDTESIVGTGTSTNQFRDGTKPSTNLIIHGHTMKSGLMFGGLKQYADENYGKSHSIICFDSLYEHREYELIAVFYSQVYINTDDVFKYYNFFQADTQVEFDDWYTNIKTMSLYNTGVTAEYGDEFITLSCCSYQIEDGRFVVVGKRK